MPQTVEFTELHLIGASCRAAAESARRAVGPNVRIVAGDLFGDGDLRAVCDEVFVLEMSEFPHGFREKVQSSDPASVWMYCGGIENAPELINEIATQRRLLGCNTTTVAGVRDPVQIVGCMFDAELPCAPVLTGDREWTSTYPKVADPTRDDRWLRKPLNSCAGHRIALLEKAAEGMEAVVMLSSDSLLDSEGNLDSYLQKFIEGELQSGSFVADGESSRWLGTTKGRTFADVTPPHPTAATHPFGYTGSIGPIVVTEAQRKQWQRIGDALTTEFGLQGLFGVDAIITKDGWITPIEINPRYTASMELLEGATGPSLVELHIKACLEQRLPGPMGDRDSESDFSIRSADVSAVKQIIYARENLTFTKSELHSAIDSWLQSGATTTGAAPKRRIADLPYFESPQRVHQFERGDPIFTVIAKGHEALVEPAPFKRPVNPLS